MEALLFVITRLNVTLTSELFSDYKTTKEEVWEKLLNIWDVIQLSTTLLNNLQTNKINLINYRNFYHTLHDKPH